MPIVLAVIGLFTLIAVGSSRVDRADGRRRVIEAQAEAARASAVARELAARAE